MQTLHYVGKQKVLCHVSLNTYQLKEVMKVFSSVFVASYDGNFSTAIDIFFFISAVHDTINVFDLHIGHFPLSGHVP